MQVDTEQAPQVPHFISYFDVSNNFPWQETRLEQIEQRRALLGDTLIFDLLLSSGGLRHPDALYPPVDASALQQLLDAIETSQYDTLKKECLVYYLLKWHQDGREERFQLDRCIPSQFTALADAYWLLDTGVNIPLAVSLLSDARINQDYASKVLQAISLAPNSSASIVKYVRTAGPALTEPRDLDSYVVALAEYCGLRDAWEFQRTFNQTSTLRSRLAKKVLEWSVTPKTKPAALRQLLFLPLSPFEESLLRSFSLESSSISPTAMAALQDLICIRLIQAGRYAEAIKTDHEFIISTSNLLKGLTIERTKMIQEIYATLPATERLLLDEELNKQQPSSLWNVSTNVSGDISISSSWEDMHVMRSPSPKHGKIAHVRTLQPSPKSSSDRSQALRFADSLPKKSLADIKLPVIPTSSTPTAPKPVSRKSFPPTFVTASNTTSKPPAKPRRSAGHVPTSSKLDMPRTIPSSFTPQKASPEPKPPTVNGTATPGFAFSSASKSKNAFYQPAPREKDVEAIPREDREAEAGVQVPLAGPSNVDMDTEMTDANIEQEKHETADNQPELQFSIFGTDAAGPSVVFNGFYDVSVSQGKKRKKVPPGAFLSDEEDGMEDEQGHEEEAWERTISAGAVSSGMRRSHPSSASEDKPVPAAERNTKSRSSATREVVQQLKRSLPGALVDEEEEEDHVAPLRQPSPSRRLRKGRSSTSSDFGEETEAPHTRRRSARLSNHVNVTSPETSPKKLSTSMRTRKSAKTSSSSTKKKR
ncbi:hypothetical protein AX15_003147 [Amanita polypyramis BW_CC]|nr:hypothetical protein AX15_003147 [Amanita polypyramis BW_CC]